MDVHATHSLDSDFKSLFLLLLILVFGFGLCQSSKLVLEYFKKGSLVTHDVRTGKTKNTTAHSPISLYPTIDRKAREIRTMSLEAGPWFSQIRCELSVVSLESKPYYETISYAWGRPEDTEEIIVNNTSLHIPRNLEMALRHIRKPKGRLILWADAICINQGNNEEKNHQVRLMGDIFRSRSSVYIWLGVPDTEYRNVDPFALSKHFGSDGHLYDLPCFEFVNEKWRFSETPEFQQMWQVFQNIVCKEWWTRLWCVQESLLPPRDIIIFGHWRISRDILKRSNRNHKRHMMSCCSDICTLLPCKYIYYPDHVVTDAQIDPKGNKNMVRSGSTDPERVLRAFRHKQCQDPRDRIFGLLGLVEQESDRQIVPNYSIAVEKVYVDAMKFLLSISKGDLRCLTGFGFNKLQRDLPSWTRDFAATLDAPSVSYEMLRYETYPLYNAAAGSEAVIEFQQPATLVLGGHLVDAIERVGAPMLGRDWSYLFHGLQNWLDVVGLEDQEEDTFWLTIMADAYIGSEQSWGRIEPFVGRDEVTWLTDVKRAFYDGTRRPPLEPHLQSMLAAVYGRSIFRTEQGRIGLCFPETLPGDQVWVLMGGKIPFLLRSDAPEHPCFYRFVGECFVHGIMDGDFFRSRQECVTRVLVR